MRILFIRDAYNNRLGGIPVQILRYADYFNSKGIQPFLVTNQQNSKLSNEFNKRGYKTFIFPQKSRLQYKWIYYFHYRYNYLKKIISENNIDVISTHKIKESLLARRIKKHNPRIMNVFRVHTHLEGRDNKFIKRFILRRIEKMTDKYVDIYIPISNKIKKELINKSKVDSKKVKVVYNGVNKLLSEVEIPKTKTPISTKIAIIGELQPRKYQEFGIQLIQKYNHNNSKKLELILIGGNTYNNYMKKLKRLVETNNLENHVTFSGHLNFSEMADLLRNVDTILITSKFEGVPLTMLESMSMGKIVISSNVGAINEVIQHNRNGFLYESGNFQQALGVLKYVFNRDHSELSSIRINAYNDWKEKYTLSNMLEKEYNLYFKNYNEKSY